MCADELQRTVVFLTRENADLREQNEVRLCVFTGLICHNAQPGSIKTRRDRCCMRWPSQIFRRVLAKHADASVMDILEHLRNENQALKVALYDTVQTLSVTTGALERGLPHAATALEAAEVERLADAAEDDQTDDDDDEGASGSSSSSSSSAAAT
jgi:hypothetical protein